MFSWFGAWPAMPAHPAHSSQPSQPRSRSCSRPKYSFRLRFGFRFRFRFRCRFRSHSGWIVAESQHKLIRIRSESYWNPNRIQMEFQQHPGSRILRESQQNLSRILAESTKTYDASERLIGWLTDWMTVRFAKISHQAEPHHNPSSCGKKPSTILEKQMMYLNSGLIDWLS